ncbi:rhomboid family intramembrane serine protease [Rhodospirillaceae bacterium KN72]|uniref:Rhomboid family intramembrane serine protease n=1 Tax=Pacificispira spongiicola TaxID=2729598 RepID=A0A7Y0E382_9PROT|nr:rhomboid family intramembrane serine protease [Pacificispira spongiicola]NMM46378.1 rhomboid family intramembrane serine protease [Pacificispira spongiicola]
MQHPFGTHQPRRNPPAFNAPGIVLQIIVVTVLMHVFRLVAPEAWVDPVLTYLVFNPGDLHFFGDYPVEISARWVGYALVHGSWLHLMVNCAFLLAFGTPIARQIPKLSFLALYALGAAGGALAVLIVYPGADLYLIGASGGVSALVGALSRMVFLRRGQEYVPPPFNNRRAGVIFILVFFGVNLLFEFLPGPGGLTVSGESHLGGFVAGFLLSLLLPWRHRQRDPHHGHGL